MLLCALFNMLLRVCLWFVVLVHSSVGVPKAYRNSLQNWLLQCSCSCLKDIPSARKNVWPHCTTEEVFTMDKQRNLQNISHLSPIPARPHFLCEEDLVKRKRSNHYRLLKLTCNGERLYVIYRQRATKLKGALRNTSTLRSDSAPTSLPTNQEETKQGKSDSPNRLVIALSGLGVGLMVAIIICWTWIRCRRKLKKKDEEENEEKEQNLKFGEIEEEEDSTPYRIVDLNTNISCDASGYTFLEAPKQDEEHPYMKLQPKCKRDQNKECTEDANHSFEEVVNNEDEDRPYETLQPTDDNKDCTKTDDFEDIADEPVYFMLEGKEKLPKTS